MIPRETVYTVGKEQKQHTILLKKKFFFFTFAECSIVTTTLVLALDTKSMAPPIPFTIFP